MSKVDFTKLSTPISDALDTDFLDIKRQVEGSPERDLIYTNIPCHIAIKTSDNPDPESVDIQPIITSLRIHCSNWVDLKNHDYVIAKKCDLNGNILNYYEGAIGEPATSMGRQYVTLAMTTIDKGEQPVPVPISDTANVIISYLDELNEPIHENVTQSYRKGDNVTITSLGIDNYTLVSSQLDDETVESVVINNIQEDHTVKFIYQAVTMITNIRMLVNGDYTRDDGTLAYGLHLYAPISVLSVESINSIKLASIKFNHDDIGVITIRVGDKFRDNLDNWHKITNIAQVDNGYIITFEDTEPVECYITNWYG